MKVKTVFFSPTGTTKAVVSQIANMIVKDIGARICEIDITPLAQRMENLVFTAKDLVIVGVPVYAGRVPNILLNYLRAMKGNNARAVAVVLYGNRSFDNALKELGQILDDDGFQVIGAGAFIGEHAFSDLLAAGRPNEEDFIEAKELAIVASNRWQSKDVGRVEIPGNESLLGYYQPHDDKGKAINILKVKPKVNEHCDGCGRCVKLCPMASIKAQDVREYQGICIKCGACMKRCPQQARYIDDAGYLYHKQELEEQYADSKKSVIYTEWEKN